MSKWFLRRSKWPPRFLGAAAWIVGARVRSEGAPLRPHSLLICNHTSWLDILIMAGATGCRFVSKDSLGHGFIHWLADQNATIYVKRSHVKGAKDQALTIAKALEGESPGLVPGGHDRPGHASASIPLDLAGGRQFRGEGRHNPPGGDRLWCCRVRAWLVRRTGQSQCAPNPEQYEL